MVSAGGLAAAIKTVMPLGAHVMYEVELIGGPALKISTPREGGTLMHQAGERVEIAPLSPESCKVFPAS